MLRDAINKKAAKKDRYGSGHILIATFEDFGFGEDPSTEISLIRDFCTLFTDLNELNVAEVHVLGTINRASCSIRPLRT